MDENETRTEGKRGTFPRRSVLKTAGAGTVGAAVLAGRTAADRSGRPNQSDDQQMATFLALFEHTETGKTNIESVPQWVEEANEKLQEMDGELRASYFGSVGTYDGFAIADFPDGKSMETFRLAFERAGTHHVEFFEVFEPEEYFGMIGNATGESE